NTTAGCGSCHGYLSSVKPAIIGPGNNSALYGRLAPGATGTFDMITVLDQTPYFQCSQGNAGRYVAVDVAASDGTLVALPSGSTRTFGGEITNTLTNDGLHPSKGLVCINVFGDVGVATYSFNYTMPNGAAPGSAHKLFGVARIGRVPGDFNDPGLGWNWTLHEG